VTLRVLFIGAVDYSRACLEHLIATNVDVVGVVCRSSSRINADFAPLDEVARVARIPFLLTNKINASDTADWIREKQPDVAFCFGWSQLIGAEVLGIPRLGIIGYHPAMLPQNRGRHPLIWALALGLEHTGSTFFFMDEGADNGDILSQRPLPIFHDDDACSLYARMTEVALAQISEFLPQLESGSFERIPQDDAHANAWRKRSAEDGRIDWRMSAVNIYNLVRALAPPYPGATIFLDGRDYPVWKSEVIDMAVPKNLEPGRVLAVEGSVVSVASGDGAIRLLDHDLPTIPTVGGTL
jgi:methionyl-tRNA formyltransferase